jgi:hypothetical protein
MNVRQRILVCFDMACRGQNDRLEAYLTLLSVSRDMSQGHLTWEGEGGTPYLTALKGSASGGDRGLQDFEVFSCDTVGMM